MEAVSTGVLEKIKNIYEVKIKPKNDMMYEDIYTIQYVKPTAQLVFKNRFLKVDQHAGGKWFIHDTKRRKDNQLQSLKLPCRISKLSSWMWHKGVRWHHVESDILKEGPGTETSWEMRVYRTPNT